MQRLILIDGNALLHRAFHALPPLTNKDGQIVNAVYGFFSMFLRIVEEFSPEYTVVCFDRPKPTFRKALYIGYQAKRPKMSDDLVPQIQMVHEILKKAKVCVFEVDGYEADDLIGTIATQAVQGPVSSFSPASAPASLTVKNGANAVSAVGNPSTAATPHTKDQKTDTEVIIVSGDRDMLQLVNNHVKVAMPIVGITKMTVFTSRKVEEKYGIKPIQIVDYKALSGDASDNYSGVAGVGPKTASSLLKEYVTLEEIYKNLDKIKNKNPNLSLKLAEGVESAGLAKKLAAIVTDAPITLDLSKCNTANSDKERMKSEFERFGFKSLVKRLGASSKEVQKKIQERNKQLGLF